MNRPMPRRALLVAFGIVVLAAPAGAQNVRIVERTRDARADSLTDRIFKANVAEVQRIVSEWRERESQLMRTLETAEAGNDITARRRAEEELARNSREAFAMMSAIQDRCERERRPQPAGYVGVSLDTKVEMVNGRVLPGEVTVSSVEPGGPSERAGVQRDDRVLSIGGLDASKGLPEIADLLIPGRTIVIRVDRNGTVKEIPVTVEKRPTGFAESCGEFERALLPLRVATFSRMIRRDPGQGGERAMAGAIESQQRREMPEEVRMMVFNPGGGTRNAMSYFAGAQFRTLDEDWREVLGVKQGVIVNEVAAGSAAARSGLKGGDVITAVGDTPVNDPIAFLHALEIDQRGEAKVSVIRGKERKMITLRWGVP